MHDLPAETSIVILVVDTLTPAGVDGFPGDDDLLVVICVVMTTDHPTTRCLLPQEAAALVHGVRLTWLIALCEVEWWSNSPLPGLQKSLLARPGPRPRRAAAAGHASSETPPHRIALHSRQDRTRARPPPIPCDEA